jgi:hypothetical protein
MVCRVSPQAPKPQAVPLSLVKVRVLCKGGLSRAIEKWVAARRFQFRDKKGKFLSYDATAFLVSRSIYNKGIKTTSFFTRPFQLKFEQLPEELATAYALELADFLRFTLQNQKE